MDKNTITGLVLIFLVIMGWGWFFGPTESEQQYAQHVRDSIEAVAQQEQQQKVAAEEAEHQRVLADSTSLFFAQRSSAAEGEKVVLDNGKLRLTLDTKGGTPVEAELYGYSNLAKDGNVKLFTKEDTEMFFTFDGKNENLSTADIMFQAVDRTDSTVTMRLDAANGGRLDLEYRLHPDAYMVDLTVRTAGLEGFFASKTRTMGVVWQQYAAQQEKGYSFEQRYASLTYKEVGEGTDYLSETSNDDHTAEKPLDWVAFKNQFFSCVMIAGDSFSDAEMHSAVQREVANAETGKTYLKHYSVSMDAPLDTKGGATQLQLYYGPNDFHLLQDHNDLAVGGKDLSLEKLIYLGWPIVRWINRFFIIYLFDWLSGWGLHMGVVLLLLTLIVKLLVYPTTRKSFLSSARMRVLKPKVDELSAQYPDPKDAMQKQQAVMQLYSRYGVSPMGGCLPMLIQMPIWIALFNFVPNAIELRGQSFLWADDLSAYDDLLHWNVDLWLIGDHISIFCLLFCATNIINNVIMQRQQNASAMTAEQEQSMKMMRWMMYAMPVMFFFMFNNYSSGLNYYYFLSGLTSILMMWYLRKTTDDNKLLAELEARYAKNKERGFAAPGGLSGMASRLQAMKQLQEEQLEQQRRERANRKNK